MTSRVGTLFAVPWRVALRRSGAASREDERASRRLRRGLLADLLGGALMLTVWILLWSFFAVAVLGPAARVHGLQGGGAASSVVRA